MLMSCAGFLKLRCSINVETSNTRETKLNKRLHNDYRVKY